MEMAGMQAVIIFIGLSLDGFVVMMDKGATLRDMNVKKNIMFAFAYAVVNAIAVIIGYGLSECFKGLLPDTVEILIACLLIFAIGMFIVVHAYKNKEVVERRDDDFDIKHCLRLAVRTSIDTLLIGASFSFLKIDLSEGILLACLVTFVMILLALKIGYSQGSHYHRAMAIIGGMLMMAFSVYLNIVSILLVR